jgi:hypothetical protein
MITEDIKKIDLLQNNLLNYIRVNNPILKTNTINTLLEEELKKYQVELGEKKIKIFKALEKDLPETAVPDDQLRYILSCALQHIMTLIPPSVSFGLLTRSIVLQREKIDDKTLAQKKEKYVEILMAYTGHETLTNLFGSGLETQGRRRDGILDLTLRLVDAIVQRNRGMMRFEEDEKKQKTIISLKFPVERRKVVYYRPANELSLSLHQSKTTFEKLSSLEEMKKSDSSTHE